MKTMKTILLFFAATIAFVSAKAQFTENFDNSTISSLSGNCWQFVGMNHTSSGGESPINGAGSLYSDPPASAFSTRDTKTPYLNITSTSFNVSFKYQLSGTLPASKTRTIEVGLQDAAGVFTSLDSVTLTSSTPVTAQSYNQYYILASTGIRRLVIKMSGNGVGTVRLILDDLYASADANYGNASPCNSAPVAVNDVFAGPVGSAVSGNVMTNDNEPNGETMNSSVVVTSADGTVVLNQNGNFTFTPNPGFIGSSTTFTYNLLDAGFDPLNSNTAVVTINFFANSPLPVKLINFDAKYNKPNVVLSWSTAMEKNFSHFVVEYSTDGINFSQAATVFGFGESDSRKDYTYTDKNTAGKGGLIYYRLQSVDIDGKSTYSSIRIIRLGEEKQGIALTTYPNPVTSELRVTIPGNWQNKKVSYEIFNANGQVTKKSETASSSQTENLNVSSLAPGLYIVKVTCDGVSVQQKIIKQ
jgi:hypothetical protein